jgi:regulatory protein
MAGSCASMANMDDDESTHMSGPDDAVTPATLDAASLERAAVEYLARYAASRAAVARVLERRIAMAVRRGVLAEAGAEAAHETARRVLDKLAGLGLLDDARFAEGRARSLVARGRSTAAIKATLRDKGIDAGGVARALDTLEAETPHPERTAAINLARRRRLGPFRPDAERAARRDKDLAVLARAGFPRDLSCRVIDAPDREALRALLADPDG